MLKLNTSGDYASFPNRLCARRILCFLKHLYLDEFGQFQLPRVCKRKGIKRKALDISCFYEQKRQEINERLSGFSSSGTSGSMISDMQIEPAVPEAPGVDATAVEGMLGGNGNLGNKAS